MASYILPEFDRWFAPNWNWCNGILGKLEVYPSLELRFQHTVFGATRPKYFRFHYYHINIPEQFTVKAHPALFEGEWEGEGEGEGEGRGWGGAKQLRNTFKRLRPEEFSSGDFGLRSFRRLEISA